MKIHNRGKFHLYSICGSQVINVQMFRGDGVSIKLPLLGGLWVLSPPDTAQFWWIFFPEIASHTSNKLLQQSFKNLYLSRKGTYWKCTVLVHIWNKFTPAKCKTLPKGSFLVKTTSLGLWNKTGSRSERIHRIFSQNFYKINQRNPFFRPKMHFLRYKISLYWEMKGPQFRLAALFWKNLTKG